MTPIHLRPVITMRQHVVLVITLPLGHQAVMPVSLGWLTWMAILRRRVYHVWLGRLL